MSFAPMLIKRLFPRPGIAVLCSLMGTGLSLPALAETLDIKLQENMNYSEAKAALIEAGWQYDNLPAYGYNALHPKVKSECFGNVEICNAYPEIEACSGQGYCKMSFYDHFGNALSVTTYGSLMPQNLVVLGWRLQQPE